MKNLNKFELKMWHDKMYMHRSTVPGGKIIFPANIKHLMVFFLFISSFFACGNTQTLPVGSKIPEFKLPDQNDNMFDIKDYLDKKNLVIYFYPKDETPGCTTEACTFRDQYEVFQKADAMVIGISGQSVESHKEFADHHQLPFTLLSDKDNTVRKLFGVRVAPIPGRVTFVVGKNGAVAYVFESQMQAAKHVDEAIRILKELK